MFPSPFQGTSTGPSRGAIISQIFDIVNTPLVNELLLQVTEQTINQ
jgi:hypothetical protein